MHPLGPLRARGFQAAVCHFEEVLLALVGPYKSERFSKVAARLLALRGFENFRQPEGLNPGDLAGRTSVSGAQALLERLLRRANEHGKGGRPTEASEVAVVLREPSAATSSSTELASIETSSDVTTTMDASRLIEIMTQASCEERWEQRQVEFKRRKLDGLGSRLTPRQAITALAKSQENGDVLPLLDQMVVDARWRCEGNPLRVQRQDCGPGSFIRCQALAIRSQLRCPPLKILAMSRGTS